VRAQRTTKLLFEFYAATFPGACAKGTTLVIAAAVAIGGLQRTSTNETKSETAREQHVHALLE